jgi:hypothetical protein
VLFPPSCFSSVFSKDFGRQLIDTITFHFSSFCFSMSVFIACHVFGLDR